jgi:hypothetical protein
VIAGSGLTDTGFPAYAVFGLFVDVRLNSTFRILLVRFITDNLKDIGAREVDTFDDSWVQTRVVHTSNDVDLYNFTITRSQWTNITGTK